MSVSSVPPVSSLQTTESNSAGYVAARKLKQTLGSDDFMQLLTTQMANQDPLKPMEDTAFIAQMSSFSSLAQMNQLTKDFSALKLSQSNATAASYIGKTVTVTDPADPSQTISGEVTGVDLTGDEPQIFINGESYGFSSIVRIDATATQAATTTN